MTGVGLEPTPPKWLVPKTSALDHSATLPIFREINFERNSVRRYTSSNIVSSEVFPHKILQEVLDVAT